MKNRYRVVTDRYNGFEAQVQFWWFPFMWFQIGGCNTHNSIERAEAYIRNGSKFVKYVELDK